MERKKEIEGYRERGRWKETDRKMERKKVRERERGR